MAELNKKAFHKPHLTCEVNNANNTKVNQCKILKDNGSNEAEEIEIQFSTAVKVRKLRMLRPNYMALMLLAGRIWRIK